MKRWAALFVLAGMSLTKAEAVEDLSPQVQAHRLWSDGFWAYTETLGTPWLDAYSASKLADSEDIAELDSAKRIIRQLLSAPAVDYSTAYFISRSCQQDGLAHWCDENNIPNRLIRQHPGRIMIPISLMTVDYASNEYDTPRNRRLLSVAAKAGDPSFPWGSLWLALEPVVERYIEQHLPPALSEDQLNDFAMLHPLLHAWTFVQQLSFPSYTGVFQLCKSRVAVSDRKAEAACLHIAGRMRSQSDTLIGRMVGYALERRVLQQIDPYDPEVLRLWRREKLEREIFNCWAEDYFQDIDPMTQVGEQELLAAYRDLGRYGETEGVKRVAIRLYESRNDPEAFDPRNCDKGLELDEDSWAELLGERDPKARWLKSIETLTNPD